MGGGWRVVRLAWACGQWDGSGWREDGCAAWRERDRRAAGCCGAQFGRVPAGFSCGTDAWRVALRRG